MNLIALPAFTDNYIWMFDDGSQAVVVDPGDAAPVLDALASRSLTLAGILVTHHHADHVGGVDRLRSVLRGPVYGPAREAIPEPFERVGGGDSFDLLGSRFEVIDVPGHTAGHIAYHRAAPEPLLFCGDTLFSAGCGRLFEGTAAQMHESLAKLAMLAPQTQICCGHEYTLSNLKFAEAVEPDNAMVRSHRAWSAARRARGENTLPSLLSLELQINPFLRCSQPAVIEAARRHDVAANDPVAVFAALRQWKNEFR